MPKFSAYMRGEKGPQGEVGQSVLLNGIVSSSSELPPNTENQKNLIYYVGNNEDRYNLYVYTTTEQSWQDLGSVNGIEGQSGGFSTNQNAQIHMLNPDANPTISITTDENSPDTAKVFNFNFGIPRSYNAGFSTNQNIEVENVNEIEDMYASISTDEQSPDTSKVFNFKFGIPRGESAGFGEIESIAELIPSASTYTQNGNIVSFNTNYENPIKEGIVNIEPVQDLHGYDNPWPSGGGKNLLDEDNAEIGTAWNGNSNSARARLVIPCKPNTAYTISMNGTLSVSNIYRTSSSTIPASSAGVEITNSSSNTFTTGSDSAYIIIAFSKTDITKADITAMKLQLEEGSTATSYAPYSNICPITGFTGMNIQRTGKNLLPTTNWSTNKRISTATGSTWSSDGWSASWYIPVDGGKTYSFYNYTQNSLYCWYDKNKTLISGNYLRGVLTAPSNAAFIRLDLPSNDLNVSAQFELGSIATPYELYQGTTYPISWSTQAGTVYNGNLNVTTGELTVTHAFITFDNQSEWGYSDIAGHERFSYQGIKNVIKKPVSSGFLTDNMICSAYKTNTANEVYSHASGNAISVAVNGIVWVYDSAYTDITTFTIAMSGVQLVYPLAEPVTYQLTPIQITTLLGQNNIWADTGDIQVSYDKFNQPHVEVIADESSPNSAKNFTFHFDIPQGPKGDKGDAFSIYEPLSFTTGSNYWVNTTTFVYPRGANDKLPIYIYNEDTDKLDNDFIFTENTITYNSEQPFNGTLYLMTSANRPSITIGEVSTTSFDGQMSISLNENSTSSDAIFDFTLASGPDGEPSGFGEITSFAELIPSTSNYIEKDSVVSFTTDDEIKEVVVDINPVQDLHGYDNPWIGGSGKNKFNWENFTNGDFSISNGVFTNTIIDTRAKFSLQLQAYSENAYIEGLGTKSCESTGRFNLTITQIPENTKTIKLKHNGSTKDLVIGFVPVDIISVPFTISFTVVSNDPTTVGGLVVSDIQIEEGSTATSYEPYSNICPITGWTGMNMTRSGKNLIDKSGFTLSKADNKRTDTTIFDYPFPPGTYTLSTNNTGNCSVNAHILNYNSGIRYAEGALPLTFTVNEGFQRIYLFITQTDYNNNKSAILSNIQVEFGSTTTEYEPYQGDDYPISWSTQAGTVYGGSLNVTTGVLTVDYQYFVVDGVNKKVTGGGTSYGYQFFTTPIPSTSIDTNISTRKHYSNSFVMVQVRAPGNAYISNYGNTVYIFLPDQTITEIADANTWFSNNNAEFVIPLATPITYQLTPTQITALLGQNNIWANTGETQVTYSKFNQPYVEVTTDEESPNSAKRFNFYFGIPQGKKGERGDSIAIYEGISFSTGSSYWNNNTLTIPRGDNNKLPIYVYNEDANKLDDNFTFTSTNIIYSTTSAFNGTLYLMSETLRNTLAIGNVSTTTYGNGSHFSLNPESTSTDAIFDVVLEQGPRGETALSAQVGRVSSTTAAPNVEIEGEQDLIFNFDLPKGEKGDKGDPFTVEVNNTIDILNYNETPVVETTSTSTGISLKFKLPPSVSARLGDLSQYNTLSLASSLVTDILPVNKGGTSATTFTVNAVLLGNGSSSFKTKNTANGAFYATSANAEPSFGVLPIAQGGTSATTAAAAWTALGGGASGKHPDSYFALAEHGTHVSYGTTVTAIGTASAGTASTVSRSDHVHNISVTTGDNNGQVKIAGTNVSVKGLGSFAYKSALSSEDLPSLDFVPLAGGTISGDITYKINTVNASLTNNNVSSTLYPTTFQVLDMSSRILAGLEGTINSNGNIDSYWYVVNYDTSGNQVAQKGIKLSMNKSGGFSCTIEGNTIIDGNTTFNAYFTVPSSMYGTTDLTPGESNLPTGQLYFVYE